MGEPMQKVKKLTGKTASKPFTALLGITYFLKLI
jgi:hypothetical protein